MQSLFESIKKADEWLKNVSVIKGEEVALKKLGLILTDEIINSTYDFKITLDHYQHIQEPISLVFMERKELLNLVREVALSNIEALKNKKKLAKVMNALAVSYANVGDLEVVAVLLRTVARLDLNIDYTSDIIDYLLDQQQPDGYFGLLPEGLIEKKEAFSAALRLTVEVIWAFYEIFLNSEEGREEKEIG
ncbi:hypothetical protein COL23_13525 [Priestia aryabhattai]|uniref:hypothetical protein n=1 Tax=Priestia aryabhattai TaxID=412384 RepID=UPI000BF74634|nr:hypothetical protein [Priestia aryabhattai]PFW75846.1 hypothetical protein COL23_13525 [Priestia aryabhattai]